MSSHQPMMSIACCSPNNGAMLTILTGLVNTVYDNYCQLEDPRKYPVDITPSSEYDFIIVGSGTGSVLATRLTENENWKVLVLERGTMPTAGTAVPGLATTVQNSCQATKLEGDLGSCPGSENGQCSILEGNVLGGWSSLGKNLYVREFRQVFDKWIQKTGCPNWDYQTVLKYYKKSENYWGEESYYHSQNGLLPISQTSSLEDPITQKFIKSFSSLGYPLTDTNGATQTGFAILDFIGKNGTKYNVAEIFLNEAKYRDNFYLSTGIKNLRLIYDEKCNRITGVTFLKNDKCYQVKANKEVILTSGSTGSPQILLHSGIGPKEQLESLDIKIIKENSQVGKNLLSNPSTFYPIINLKNYTQADGSQFENLFNYLLKRNGALTSFNYENLAGYINSKLNSPQLDYPDIKLVPLIINKNNHELLNQLLDKSNYNQNIKNIFLKLNSENTLLIFRIINLQSKNIGDVILKSKNEENPIVRNNLFSNPDDFDRLLDGIDFIKELIKTKEMQELGAEMVTNEKFESCEYLIGDEREYTICVLRLLSIPTDSVGSCSMGKVVDCDMKFKNIDSLRIIDSSIVPVLDTDISVAQGVMLAEYGADLIKQNWGYHQDIKNSIQFYPL